LSFDILRILSLSNGPSFALNEAKQANPAHHMGG